MGLAGPQRQQQQQRQHLKAVRVLVQVPQTMHIRHNHHQQKEHITRMIREKMVLSMCLTAASTKPSLFLSRSPKERRLKSSALRIISQVEGEDLGSCRRQAAMYSDKRKRN